MLPAMPANAASVQPVVHSYFGNPMTKARLTSRLVRLTVNRVSSLKNISTWQQRVTTTPFATGYRRRIDPKGLFYQYRAEFLSVNRKRAIQQPYSSGSWHLKLAGYVADPPNPRVRRIERSRCHNPNKATTRRMSSAQRSAPHHLPAYHFAVRCLGTSRHKAACPRSKSEAHPYR